MEEVGMEAYDGDVNVHNRIIELYTSSTDDETQNRIVDQFKKSDGKLRVLVATVAFGMGIQITNISIIIKWGAPKTLMSYWQEVGRCARDNRRGLAVMYPYPRSLTGSDKNVVKHWVLSLRRIKCV
ncbi:ATP-dependent DNA helicase RecQ-like [Mytilus trossulus]|uniref:ATP-dependent DNA helicase RecQ-like n=1 Tax=Mytilus trossulus TaxID=6551 RepID=UPI0030059F27